MDSDMAFIEMLYPRISETIVYHWTLPTLKPILLDLILSDRDHRNGFSTEVMSELVMLYNLSEMNKPSEWCW